MNQLYKLLNEYTDETEPIHYLLSAGVIAVKIMTNIPRTIEYIADDVTNNTVGDHIGSSEEGGRPDCLGRIRAGRDALCGAVGLARLTQLWRRAHERIGHAADREDLSPEGGGRPGENREDLCTPRTRHVPNAQLGAHAACVSLPPARVSSPC